MYIDQMSVLTNTGDIESLQDSISETESKILILAESIKKISKRLEKLEKIAQDKGLLDKEDTETCIIS